MYDDTEIEGDLNEEIADDPSRDTASEWQRIRERLKPKIRQAKDTSVYLRGQKLAESSEKETVYEFEQPSEDGPDRSAFVMLQGIKAGNISAEDLSVDERRVVVQALKSQGRTQDEIAAMLTVSRRTIVSDYQWLREVAASDVRELDIYTLAGEIYSTSKVCIQRALSEGMYKTVSMVLRDMVEILQSLGVVYKAPSTLRSVQLTAKLPTSQGYLKYKDAIRGEEDQVIAVLGEVMKQLEAPPDKLS